jgi:hypothetical protein
MRSALLSLLLLACGDAPKPNTDASITLIDAHMIDATVDAPPDATNMNVVVACMHACDAVFACSGEQPAPECYSECATDLADCTDQQVAAVDACSSEECGDLKSDDSPLLTCITQVSCVDYAVPEAARSWQRR